MEINNFGSTSGALPAGFKYTSTGIVGNTTNPDTIQLKTQFGIWASIFYAASDRRIKKNIAPYDATNVLQTLQQIRPVTYQYIDQVNRHRQIEYGFVAQDIQPVLPYAVTKGIDYIPNIYDLADWSTLTKSTTLITLRNKLTDDLQIHDELKILDLRERPILLQIMEKTTQSIIVNGNLEDLVAEYEYEQETQQDISPQTVFVYGKKVDDLQVVDKDAIFSVGMAAMQEIDHITQQHVNRLQEHQEILDEIKKKTQIMKEQKE
jgi:hypothetical protein